MGTWRGEKFSGNSSRAKLAKIYSALIKCPIQYHNLIALDETGNFEKSLDTDSFVCSSCYLFGKKLLQQYGEDIRSTESIMQSLTAKVGDLKERVQTIGEHEEILHYCVLPFF